MSSAVAFAKINLALLVGPLRDDGKHEVVTLLQQVDLHDTITLAPSDELAVEGFADDTIVRRALEALARAVGQSPRWEVRIEKRIPIASGLGGGSSDAAAALQLANATLAEPLSGDALHRLAAGIGADVPFFLHRGCLLATGDGTSLTQAEVPTGYVIVLLLPRLETKESTAAVYAEFDARSGEAGFAERAERLRASIATLGAPRDLAALPANDLASSPFTHDLEAAGAFRADVSGAGPTVYGLFDDETTAIAAAARLATAGRTFVTRPVGASDRT